MKKVEFEERLSFWETRFPDKGAALMEILQPFYSWKPDLKPPLPNLEERAESAVHWRQVQSVRLFQPSSRAPLGASIRAPLGASIWDSLRATLQASIQDSPWASLEDPLRRDPLRDSLVVSLWNSYEASLRRLLENSLQVSYQDSLGGSLWDSQYIACCFILAGKSKEAAKFKPLLDLFVAGNFPLGFDNEGNLLVLVAD